MKKEILEVPHGIRYISEWCTMEGGYKLENYQFPHMVNKQITGCGFTEYCLTNSLDTIICSPRKILLENKEDQHSEDVFYFKNEFVEMAQLEYDQDISLPNLKVEKNIVAIKAKTEDVDPDIVSKRLFLLKKDLLSYMEMRRSQGKPIKILVTYDSFHLIREFIQASDRFVIDSFYIVIDEFQSIFTDSRFKSDTELKFLSDIVGLRKLCFVSATPMLDHYLEMLDEFKDLPYYEFDWRSADGSRVIKPVISVRSSNSSLITDARLVIESYLNGDFEKYTYTDSLGRVCVVESREAVLYFNSVKNICDIIRKCKLTPDNTNVLCSTSLTNQASIKKAFKESCGTKLGGIGTVPKRGEPHKMFTLCTRTVYLGADFYSTNARTFIFSDPNIDCLAVDISLDLPQILGRQRLNINPWKNCATLFYKTVGNSKRRTKQEFDDIIKIKRQKTMDLILNATGISDPTVKTSVIETYEDAVKSTHYSKSYLAINHGTNGELIPVLNNLVMVSEMRAFDVQQIDYRNRFSVFNSLEVNANSEIDNSSDKLLIDFENLKSFPEKMEYVCRVVSNLGIHNVNTFLGSIPIQFRNYVSVLGPDRCAAFSYRRSLLEKELKSVLNIQTGDIRSIVLEKFEVGKRYSLVEIKDFLRNLYISSGIDRTPKATDIEEYFEVKEAAVFESIDNRKKRLRAFEIISIK